MQKRFGSFSLLSSVRFQTRTPIQLSRRYFSDEEVDNKKEQQDIKKLLERVNQFVTTFKEAEKFKPTWTEEEQNEHTRIAKEYHKQYRLRENRYGRDLNFKIWLQREAVNALPENLKAAALVIDPTPPPKTRPWPMFNTPPLKDFNMKDYVKRDTSTEEEEAD